MSRRLRAILLAGALTVLLVTGCSDESGQSGEDSTDAVGESSVEEATEDGGGSDTQEFTVSSEAFEDGGEIEVRYCNVGVDGAENLSIPLSWDGAPEATQSFALIMVDRHDIADEWVHWMVTGIPASTTTLVEGESGSMPTGAVELLSTNGERGYQGPEPPVGSGDHEYETLVFALDAANVEVAEDATYGEFLDAIEADHLAETSISGYFGR